MSAIEGENVVDADRLLEILDELVITTKSRLKSLDENIYYCDVRGIIESTENIKNGFEGINKISQEIYDDFYRKLTPEQEEKQQKYLKERDKLYLYMDELKNKAKDNCSCKSKKRDKDLREMEKKRKLEAEEWSRTHPISLGDLFS